MPGLDVSGDDRFRTLLEELERWNRRINLTSVRDRDRMVTLHLLDSLSIRPFLKGKRVLDVGTGAGFPGLPLAIAEPDRSFDLIDGNNRKIMFVQHVVGLLGLENVTATKARAEDYAPGHRFDTVIARALAALPRLLKLAGHHVAKDGVFVALKGRYPTDELEGIPDTWRADVEELEVPDLGAGSRHAVLLSRKQV